MTDRPDDRHAPNDEVDEVGLERQRQLKTASKKRQLGRRALRRLRYRVRHLPPLPGWLRIALAVLGWVLILLGVVQIVTPGPGTVFMVAGAALLSLVSRRIHALLRRLFRPWPKGWRMLLQFRRRIRFWLHRRFTRKKTRKAP